MEHVEKINYSKLIKERRWTKKLIEKYLPEPCELKENPFYKSAAPMKLYLIEKIIEIEKDERFKEDFKKAKKRSATAKKIVEKKEMETIDLINNITINIENIDEEIIKANAIFNYEMWNDCIVYNADENFYNRIMVNYIRHNLTKYDDVIESLFRKVGKQKAYILLKNKTLDKIAEKYSLLKDECERQKIL